MESWIRLALASMVFAGVTSVIAKLGLTGISAETGLAVRTVFVFVLTMSFSIVAVPRQDLTALSLGNVAWLGLSAVTTTISWIFYYRAIKLGDVSVVAVIDKGSLVVAVVLAALVLKEPLTGRTVLGVILMVSGMFLVSSR